MYFDTTKILKEGWFSERGGIKRPLIFENRNFAWGDSQEIAPPPEIVLQKWRILRKFPRNKKPIEIIARWQLLFFFYQGKLRTDIKIKTL